MPDEHLEDLSKLVGRAAPALKAMWTFVAGTAAAMATALGMAAGVGSEKGSASSAPAKPPASTGDVLTTLYVNGNVVTMDPAGSRAQAVAVTNGLISAVGDTGALQAQVAPGTVVVDLDGATVLPGFIDPHSHLAGYATYLNTDWVDVSAINDYFKPSPSTGGGEDPEPQEWFVPVETQADVDARLRKRVEQLPPSNGSPQYIAAFNYDASRLGHGPACPDLNGQGFSCPNLENGHAREMLDAISADIPILVTAQSGHCAFVNTPALKLLNICGTPFADDGCYHPWINPEVEIALANLGQLDEDLALYAIPKFAGLIYKQQAAHLPEDLLLQAAQIYAQHGYTLVQEGAASLAMMAMYWDFLRPDSKRRDEFPVAAAMIAYDNDSGDFNDTLKVARDGRLMIGDDNPLLSVAAIKDFCDGSPQCYTADLTAPYLESFPPFTDASLFHKQPYTGLPDIGQADLEQRLCTAHDAGFPMILHMNGDQAITNAVTALVKTQDVTPPDGRRDVVLHAPMISTEQLRQIAGLGTAVVSFLSPNLYFYALPECQQILGPDRVLNSYPARAAIDILGRVTLHTDTPVEPPDPLFTIWSAVTRKVQQPSWYTNLNRDCCPPIAVAAELPGDQRITIFEGIKAMTVDAAWQYGMEDVRGTIEVGKYADMVFLSDDPLGDAMVADPDQLKTIRVLGTVSYGRHFPNPHADQPPVWPGDR